MPTIQQIRAARALIGWSQGELAAQSNLSQTGIARIENGTNQPNSTTIQKIISAFDRADIEFIGESGVRKRSGDVKKFRGKTGLIQFMDDVYESAKTVGGDMCFYNIVPQNWLNTLGEEWWKSHVDRMKKYNAQTNIQIMVPEGNDAFISTEYAQYKWFPKDFELSGKRSLYVYGGKLGFVTFHEDSEDIEVLLLKNKDFSDGVKALFDIAWDNVARRPNKEQ